jgi:hypothetical protein
MGAHAVASGPGSGVGGVAEIVVKVVFKGIIAIVIVLVVGLLPIWMVFGLLLHKPDHGIVAGLLLAVALQACPLTRPPFLRGRRGL